MSKLVQCTHWLLTHCLGSRSGLQPHVSTDPPATTSSPPTSTPETLCSTCHNTQTLCNIYVQPSQSSTSRFNRPSSSDLISANIDSGNSMFYRPSCRLHVQANPIIACITTSAQRCAKTSVCREADFAPDLKPHVSQDPSEDRSSWMFFIQVVHGRPGGRLQFSGAGLKMAWLASRLDYVPKILTSWLINKHPFNGIFPRTSWVGCTR